MLSCGRWLVCYDPSFYLNQLFYYHQLFFSSFTQREHIEKLASHISLRINPFSSCYSGLIVRKQRNLLTLTFTFYSLFLCQSVLVVLFTLLISSSIAMMNKYGARGSSCRRPLVDPNHFVGEQLIRTLNFGHLTQPITQSTNFISTSFRKSHRNMS